MNDFLFSLPLLHDDVPIINSFSLNENVSKNLLMMPSNFLHPQEIEMFEAFSSHEAKLNFLSGRYCAKKAILEIFPRLNPLDILITAGVWGQPIIVSPYISNMGISISHRKTKAIALAFPEKYPMGIDMEEIKINNLEALRAMILPDEFAQLSCLFPQAEEITILTILWTMKEAISKALKTGISVSIDIFKTCNFKLQDLLMSCEFTCFPQYKAISWQFKNYILTVVFPVQLILKSFVLPGFINYNSCESN